MSLCGGRKTAGFPDRKEKGMYRAVFAGSEQGSGCVRRRQYRRGTCRILMARYRKKRWLERIGCFFELDASGIFW